MKKLILALGLLFCANAQAATYYLSNDTGGYITAASSNINSCSLASPCRDWDNKGFDSTNALSPGDTVYFDAGDEWPESYSRLKIMSSGTAANPIRILPYGGSSFRLLGVSPITGFSACSSGCPANTYEKSYTAFSPWEFKTVTQGEDKALGRYAFKVGTTTYAGSPGGTTSVTRATLPEGHFFYDDSTHMLYIRLWGEVDPATTTIRVPTQRPGDGMGLLAIAPLDTTSTYGKHIYIEGADLFGHSSFGISVSGGGNVVIKNVTVTGMGHDGYLSFYGSGQGNGNADDVVVDGGTFTYNSAAGTGGGQSLTTYSRAMWNNVTAHHNFMAGFDWLQGFNNNTARTTYSACKTCTSYSNGLWGHPWSYDPGFYIDGGNNITIKDSQCYDQGVAVAGAVPTNARPCMKIGAEFPSVSPVYNIDIVNNYIRQTKWIGIQTENIPGTVSNITGLRMVGNTIISLRAGTDSTVATMLANTAGTANGIVSRNNLMVARSGGYVDANVLTDARFSANNNLYYVTGGGSNIFHTCGWSWCSGTAYDFATWKSVSGEDADSINADPQFINDTEGSFDVHLKQTAAGQATTSPAVDAGMVGAWACPAYLTTYWAAYFPECAPGQQPIQGTTRSDGVTDDISINPDIGYHYPVGDQGGEPAGPGTFTSCTVSHSSSATSTNGTLTIACTNENAWEANGKLKLTADADFTFNSGGTTAAACTGGCDGILTTNIAGNIVTLTRGSSTADPTTSVLDNFNRTNEGPPASSSWTTKNGDGWKVVSNQVQTQTTSAGWSNDYWNAANYQDVDAYVTVVTKPANGATMALQARHNTTTDANYHVILAPSSGTDVIRLEYYNGTSNTVLASYNQEVSSGDTIRLSIFGSALRAYYKPSGGAWTTLGAAVTDSNLTASGRISLFANNASAVVLDNLGGGTIGSAPTVTSASEMAASTAFTITLSNVQTPNTNQDASDFELQTLTTNDSIIDVKSDIDGGTYTAPVASNPSAITGTFSSTGSFTLDV